jgi:hypothetical protein
MWVQLCSSASLPAIRGKDLRAAHIPTKRRQIGSLRGHSLISGFGDNLWAACLGGNCCAGRGQGRSQSAEFSQGPEQRTKPFFRGPAVWVAACKQATCQEICRSMPAIRESKEPEELEKLEPSSAGSVCHQAAPSPFPSRAGLISAAARAASNPGKRLIFPVPRSAMRVCSGLRGLSGSRRAIFIGSQDDMTGAHCGSAIKKATSDEPGQVSAANKMTTRLTMLQPGRKETDPDMARTHGMDCGSNYARSTSQIHVATPASPTSTRFWMRIANYSAKWAWNGLPPQYG